MLPSGPRPGLEEIEPRLLYSADAALLLGGLPVADVRQVASASAAASSQDDSGARWLLVDRRAEDWDRLLAEAQALDPSRPLQLRWVEPDEDGAALRTAVGEGDGAQAALVAAWTDADGRAWLGRSALDAAPPPPSPPPVAAALAAAVETGPAEDWTLAVRRELVIIDGRIEGAGALAALWWQDENSTRTLEVIVTDPSRDGLSQIGELLAARGGQEGLAALHLVGHGTAGQFSFGGDAIDAGTLARHEDALRAWGRAFAEGGDLLLYGCDTGAGSQGEALLEALQALTGADVAASTDATGGSAAGADWDLEAACGTVETTLSAPAAEALARWEGRLASYTVTDFTDNPFSFFTLRAAIDSANSSAGADTITFANFGVPMTIELSSMLPTITGTVSIDASSGGAPTVTLDGRFLGGGADGLQLYSGSDGSTVRGLRIQNFSQDGIDISGSGNHVIAGNWIGLDRLGSGAAGNQQGVNLWNTSGNRIGGSSEADRNIISGNSGVGIYIGGGSTANRIEGNWIGLDSTGAVAVGNLNFGILVESAGNTLGGTGSSARNIVSGNGDGIVLSGGSASGNQILGNWVGLSAAGSSAIGNTFDGIRLENGASGNTVGGAASGARNVISGNGRDGVRITDEASDGNAVLGNWIGSNAAGTAAPGNGGDGIFIRNGADSSRIGGAAPGEGNWVVSPGLVGIKIDGSSTGTTIRGNRVGTDLAGSANFGAVQNGILLENGAAQSSIVENTVAFSGRGGVYTDGIDLLSTAGSGNLISRNTLYSNVGQDINLGVDGLDGNDSLDADSGVNDLQNHPLLSSATLGAGTLRVLGQLDSAVSALYRIEFFADPGGQGDARVYLGQTTVTSDAGGRASIDALLEASLAAGATVTATATRVSSGSTSEAAVPVTVAARANTAPGFVAASGQVITPVSGGDDWIRTMQIQDDGRILVAGYQPGAGGAQDVLLMRYRADGTLDTTFGSGGRVTVAAASFGGTTAQVWAMAVQADGAIVLAGQATVGGVQYALVQRYLADGSLDSSFSGDGTALWGDVSQFCEASAVAIDAQGRIVLGGTVSGATAVARVTADGMLDTAFGGGNGYAWVDAGLGADLVGALAIQSDGRILLGGSAGNDHALVRWNDDGTLDAGFGSGGIVRTDVAGGFDMIRALVVQDDGRILAGGYSTQAGSGIDFTLLRYLASGSVDTGFSGDGRVTTDLGGADIVQAMVRDASGRIVLAGYDGSGRIALVRHLADGSLDTGFGQGGIVQQAIGASSGAGALALRPDGRLVAAGWSSDGTQRDPLLLGLLTDGSLDPGVGSAAATLGGTVAWTEGATAVVLDADVRLNDADLAQAGSYAGATLTLARQGGAQAQDQLAFDGLVVTVSGTAVLVDGVQVGSYTFTGGQMQVSFGAQATQDRVDRLARHIVYWNSSDAPPASVTIAWTLADGNTGAQGSGGALAGAGSVTVAITAVNDAPTLALPGRQSTPVDTPLVLDSASGRAPQVADADAALLQVTLTSDGHGLLTLSGTTGLSFSAGDGSADATLTFSGSAAAINAALDGLRFAPSAAYQGGATIGFSVSDLGGSGSGGTLTDTGSVIVEVGALRFRDGSAGYAGTKDTYIDDSAPGSAFGTSTTVRADDGSPRQTALIRFDQIIGNGAGQVPAGATITSATLSLYVTECDDADTVVLHRMRIDWSESSTHASLVNGIQADGSDAEASGIAIDAGLSGWINISGLAATVQAWVDGAPNFGWAIVSDAADTWAFASSESADVMLRPYLTVAYTVPQAPVLGTSAGGASYVENAAPVAVDPALTLSDADSTQLSGASVVISAGHVAAQDVLSWAAVTGISGSWNAATGTLSFSGTAALADYRTLLRSVSYANSSDSPSGASRTLSFTVTDTTGLSSAAATRSIQLSAVNDAPTVATPIADQSATEDQPFSFQIPAGTFADVDVGDSLSYTTSTLPSWLSFDAATRTFSGTPANADVGALTITVTAKDGSNAAASDSFVLTIANVNDAPTVASPIADQSATQDQPFSFQLPAGTFADVDAGDSLSYTTSALPSWLSFNAATRTFSGTPANADVGALTITVTAKDGSNATASDSFVLTIANVNDAPTVASPIADQSATEDQSFSFQLPAGTFADVDAGDSLSYTTSTLPSWLSFNAATRTFSGTPANADVGSLTITVTAKDGSNAAASDSFVLTVTNVNDAPTVATPIADQDATEDQPFSFQIPSGTFADVDAGDSLSYTTSTLPSWLSFDAATRTFSGTPANADVGSLTITVTAKDGSNATATDSFVLTVTNVNDAPTVASPIADQSATEDQPFSFQLPAGTFADVDVGDSLSYTTSTLPSWLSFNMATRTFSGTPANADVGTLTITVTAKDGSNAAASDSFVLTVTNVNDAPTVATPIADQSATEDQPFSFQIPSGTFADVDAGDSLSYTTSTLPSWLSFNMATRTFSGTPANADVGTLTITVTAKDGSNAAASDSFVLTVTNVNDAPTVATPIADQSATEDQPFSFQIPSGTFADVDAGDSLSYTTSTLPSWLSFNAATRTFSGTPANADVGALTITVTAKDGSNAAASDSFVLTVTNVNDAPTVATPIADQSATEDQPFSFQIPSGTFADVDAGDSLSYTTSTLPSWLSFNAATRTFSGTPANADVGALTITVTAKDGSNAAASDSFVLTVTNVNDAPTVATPIADQSATEDQPFSFQLPAGTFVDVDAGDSLSYTTSTLPSWLNFDASTRTFSGTPANADVGSLTITVTAKDGSNATASDSFVLTIANVNDAPTVASPIADQSATEDQPFSFQLPAGTFADVDAGDSLSYTTSTLPSWLSFNAATRTFSGTPANADVGSLTITVTAKDGSNATASDSFVLTVTNVNDAPTVATPIADQDATEDQPFSFQIPSGTFADVDAGDSLSYTTSTLPSWLSFNTATRTFSGTPANADVGSLTITVTAKDGSNAAASDSFVLTIANVNDAPTVASPITDQSATEDQSFSFQIPSGTFADVDAGDSLSYTTSALPSWLSFNTATRTFSGTPANADVGTLTITVTAKDGSNATVTDSFVLTVTNVNDAPTVASPIADQSATQDLPFSFQLPAGTFADVDAGDSLSYTTSTLPSWLSFNAATRTFSGTPANADVGALTITVTAKDGSNAAASDSFVLTVTNVNDAPTVATPIADQDATEDQPFSFQIPSGTFADVDAGDSLSYTTSTLPSWLSFNAATRTFSGTPANADVGSLTITVTAKDGSNATASDSFVLTVENVNDAPILQAGGPLMLEEGGHQVLTLADLLPADVDDDERSLVFERVGGASAGRLERVDAPGVAVDRFSAGDLADGLIRYVHDGSESVSDRLELRVRDVSGALSDPVRLEIVITPVDDEAPRIVSSGGQARVVLDHSENSPWQRVMQASDADRPLSVLQWRIAGGADAARFEIDADSGELRLLGLLDREQPQDADRDNHYEVLIEVSDGRQAATQQLLLRITDVDEAPEIEIGLLQVDQGMRLRLDESLLRAQDVDSTADVLVYRVVAVENGRFVAAGGNSVLTTFSQADVAAGRVVFQHDENSLAARFSLVLSDGRNESGVMSIEIAVRERGFDAGSMPTEPPPDRMPASSALVVSGIEPADPMRERTQQAQASQEIVRAAVLRGLAAREGGGAGAAELVAGDLMAGWVDALRRFATLSASETQAARPGALRGEVGFSVDLMRLPDSDLLVLLDVVLDLAGFEATALIRPVSEGVGGTQTASGETARSAGTDEPENLLQREWQSGTVARTGAVVMSAGALFWAVRAGGLAASLAFASPVWWRLDPLPVLQAARRETAGAEAGRRGWRDTGVTGELAGLAEDLLDRQG